MCGGAMTIEEHDAEPAFATNTARGVAASRRAEVFLDV